MWYGHSQETTVSDSLHPVYGEAYPVPHRDGGVRRCKLLESHLAGFRSYGSSVALGKHNYDLQAMTAFIARRLGNALIAPIIKFVPEGNIDSPSDHMKFPDTISLTERSFRLLLIDIGNSLRQSGFRNIVLLGDSGENQIGMKEVAVSLNHK